MPESLLQPIASILPPSPTLLQVVCRRVPLPWGSLQRSARSLRRTAGWLSEIKWGVANLITTDAAAKYLGVTPQRVRQLVVAETISATKYGRDYLLDAESVQTYKKNRKKAGRPKK